MSVRTPFEDTSVPIERSQAQIRTLLQNAGALGVSFDEEWGDQPRCVVRFVWPLQEHKQRIRLDVRPLPPGKLARGRADAAQRQRQAWRGLAWYLDSTIKAATFGLIRFEDVFLSFMEIPTGEHAGQTLGDVVIPQLANGRLALAEATA
jgi:hypothetical protein